LSWILVQGLCQRTDTLSDLDKDAGIERETSPEVGWWTWN